ncbi:MAG TPA: hypothetical protein VEC39_19520 [Vicinamibacterales bacterium]|nr:hypothetical protein [Vicinamibacterales bacterium]
MGELYLAPNNHDAWLNCTWHLITEVVTHQGLLYRAFRTLARGSVKEGDCLIVRPGGDAGGEIAAHVSAADWQRAARSQ